MRIESVYIEVLDNYSKSSRKSSLAEIEYRGEQSTLRSVSLLIHKGFQIAMVRTCNVYFDQKKLTQT